MNLRFTLFLLALSLTFTACKKDKEEPKPAPTKTDLLTGKDWLTIAYRVDPAADVLGTGVAISDIYAQFPSTDKDDLVRFDKPNVWKYDEGPTSVPGSVQTVSGIWTFSTDETKVTVTPQGGSPSTYDLLELSDGTLKTRNVITQGGVNYTFERTYRKK